jgi:hypothetical protein
MSDAVGKIADALAEISEAEASAILSNLGLQGPREPQRAAAPRTPLPAPRESPGIRSEIEWV